jgi:hypothetical protein
MEGKEEKKNLYEESRSEAGKGSARRPGSLAAYHRGWDILHGNIPDCDCGDDCEECKCLEE